MYINNNPPCLLCGAKKCTQLHNGRYYCYACSKTWGELTNGNPLCAGCGCGTCRVAEDSFECCTCRKRTHVKADGIAVLAKPYNPMRPTRKYSPSSRWRRCPCSREVECRENMREEGPTFCELITEQA
jgi:hypothetical protein